MNDQSWIPPDVDMSRPNPARMYDYLLGGYHNFEVDRQAAEHVMQVLPSSRAMAQANRVFVRRVVDFMLDEGIRQFMDIGAGIPTVGHIHDHAAERNIPVRVIYVDRDPIAVAHGEMLLAGNKSAAAIHADARNPQDILDHPKTKALIDFEEPVGFICTTVLPFIRDDEEVFALLDEFFSALAPRSYVCLTHTCEELAGDNLQRVVEMYKQSSDPARLRPKAVIERFFDGLELVEPGLVLSLCWRSDASLPDFVANGDYTDITGVARVPATGWVGAG